MQEAQWIKIADDIQAITFGENHMAEVTVAGRQVCLVKQNAIIYAVAAHCPHGGVPLCSGYLDARGNIVCPKHHYRFAPRNGYNVSGEGYFLKHWPVKMDNGIYIQLPPA